MKKIKQVCNNSDECFGLTHCGPAQLSAYILAKYCYKQISGRRRKRDRWALWSTFGSTKILFYSGL